MSCGAPEWTETQSHYHPEITSSNPDDVGSPRAQNWLSSQGGITATLANHRCHACRMGHMSLVLECVLQPPEAA